VSYGPELRHRLDVYLPAAASPAPMVLFVHGGAWMSGDKMHYAWLGEQLARHGMMVAVANYRLSPAVHHPAHAQDVAKVVAWLHHHGPNFGGDPQRLFVAGHSAGAHLASLVALDGSYLAAEGLGTAVIRSVVGIAGAGYDLDARYAATPLAQFFTPAFGMDPARWADAAPLRFVQAAAPPFFLIHGLNDTMAPASSTQVFAAALQQQGVPTRLDLLPSQDHYTVLVTALPIMGAFVQQGGAPAVHPEQALTGEGVAPAP
jgi:acetyl esterase/lipase